MTLEKINYAKEYHMNTHTLLCLVSGGIALTLLYYLREIYLNSKSDKQNESEKQSSQRRTALQDEREHLGFSVAQMATIGGVSERKQLEFESHLDSPDSDYLVNLAMFGIDIRYVLKGKRIQNPSLAMRLKHERERIGISKKDLAIIAGVSENTQQQYEEDDIDIPIGYLVTVAQQTKIDICYVISGERSPSVKDGEIFREAFYNSVREIEDWMKEKNFVLTDRKIIRVVLQLCQMKLNINT